MGQIMSSITIALFFLETTLNKENNIVKFTDRNGNTYKGEWKAYSGRHGIGRQVYSNGDMYYGNWKNNYIDDSI
jgi:hypothetical protein